MYTKEFTVYVFFLKKEPKVQIKLMNAQCMRKQTIMEV